MKRSISPILKLSGKPINSVNDTKKFLDENEILGRHSVLSIVRNSQYGGVDVDRKGFIRALRKLDRWVVSCTEAVGTGGDGDCPRVNYYSRMSKGRPIFSRRRIRVYKTRSGAERAKQRLISTGMFLTHSISLIRT